MLKHRALPGIASPSSQSAPDLDSVRPNMTNTTPSIVRAKLDDDDQGTLMAPVEDVGEDIVEICDDDETEVQPANRSPDPGQPTAADMERHRCDHIPYRSWCKWCGMGRGRGVQHKQAGNATPHS